MVGMGQQGVGMERVGMGQQGEGTKAVGAGAAAAGRRWGRWVGHTAAAGELEF